MLVTVARNDTAPNEAYTDPRQGHPTLGLEAIGASRSVAVRHAVPPTPHRGTRMEVVLDASVLLDPTFLEVVHRAQIKAANARRLLAIKRHKLAAAQAYTNKAAARAIQMRVPRARGSIR